MDENEYFKVIEFIIGFLKKKKKIIVEIFLEDRIKSLM